MCYWTKFNKIRDLYDKTHAFRLHLNKGNCVIPYPFCLGLDFRILDLYFLYYICQTERNLLN